MSIYPPLLQWLSQPRSVERMDVDRQREWRKLVKTWKAGVKVRAKIGVVQALCDEVAKARQAKHPWVCPDWLRDEWVEALYVAIVTNQHPSELLKGFVESAEITFFNTRHEPSPDRVLEAVDKIYKQLSRRMRVKFGVFTTTRE